MYQLEAMLPVADGLLRPKIAVPKGTHLGQSIATQKGKSVASGAKNDTISRFSMSRPTLVAFAYSDA
jgi:hypothetical protein